MRNRQEMKDENGYKKKKKKEYVKTVEPKDKGYKLTKNIVKTNGRNTTTGYRKA